MKYESIGGEVLKNSTGSRLTDKVVHYIMPCEPTKNKWSIGDILEVVPANSTESIHAADAESPCVHDYVEIPAVACTKCGYVRR